MYDTYISLKRQLSHEDYISIKKLEDTCMEHCRQYLKLELDLKFNMASLGIMNSADCVNDFLYYSDRQLTGYLSIFNLGGKTCELSGMVHPLYRRKGIFTKLFSLAMDECKRRRLSEILLVCDNRSDSGQAFIKKTGAVSSFSEYLMSRPVCLKSDLSSNLTLRKADNRDTAAIAQLNLSCFGIAGFTGMLPEEEEKINRITYLICLDTKIIGKIRIETSGNQAIIGGFCIHPKFRGKGYGKQALITAINDLPENIKSVHLLVDTGNHAALKVYKDCGFDRLTTLNYYRV